MLCWRFAALWLVAACIHKLTMLHEVAELLWCCLQGYVRNDATGEYATADKMTEVSGMMATYGNIKPNRRTFALQVEGFLNAQELEVQSAVETHPVKYLTSSL